MIIQHISRVYSEVQWAAALTASVNELPREPELVHPHFIISLVTFEKPAGLKDAFCIFCGGAADSSELRRRKRSNWTCHSQPAGHKNIVTSEPVVTDFLSDDLHVTQSE